tara:strand:- start:2334 stop:3404 length:1071 start_codon:yes stop_codon:yes gene_type:complete
MNVQKNYGLDIARIIAAFLVFIPHLILNFSNNLAYTNIAYAISTIGVELFFCLSGYLICRQGLYIATSKNFFLKNTIVFIKRRVLRTWPAYFFALISYIFFYRYLENELIFYFFFLQNLFYPMVSNTFFSVSWSICVEELFYIIFPALLCAIAFMLRKIKIQPKLLIIFTCLIIILVIFLTRINLNYNDWGSEVRRVSFLRLDAIAFGGLSYFLFQRHANLKYLKLLVLSLGICSMILIYHYFVFYLENNSFESFIVSSNLIFYYIYLFCISVIFLLDRTIKVTNIFSKNTISELANWAYPIYLMHILIIDLIKSLNINSLLINILLILIINFFTAHIIRKYLELTFIKIRPKYLS